jgi:hypothetical protein
MSGPDARDSFRNGSQYVTTREFDNHCSGQDDRLRDIEKRVDDMEAKWDRYVGPVVLLAGTLTIVATVSNLILIFVGLTGGG